MDTGTNDDLFYISSLGQADVGGILSYDDQFFWIDGYWFAVQVMNVTVHPDPAPKSLRVATMAESDFKGLRNMTTLCQTALVVTADKVINIK